MPAREDIKESAGKEVVEAVTAVYSGRRYLSQRIAENVIEDYVQPRESAVWLQRIEKKCRIHTP